MPLLIIFPLFQDFLYLFTDKFQNETLSCTIREVFIFANFTSGHEDANIKAHKNNLLQQSYIINVDTSAVVDTTFVNIYVDTENIPTCRYNIQHIDKRTVEK